MYIPYISCTHLGQVKTRPPGPRSSPCSEVSRQRAHIQRGTLSLRRRTLASGRPTRLGQPSSKWSKYADKFKSFDARIIVLRMKKRKKGDDDDDDDSPRIRTNLSPIARKFIDEFLEMYKSLSGDFKARNRLYKHILEQALTRKETLNSESWGVPTIQKRLQNTLTVANKREEAEDAD